PVLDQIFGGQRFDLRLRIAELGQVAEMDELQPVAGGADLAIDLQAALQLGAVELAQEAVMVPVLLGRFRRLGGLRAQRRGGEDEELAHQAVPPALAAFALVLASTDSEIEPGRASGFSTKPSSGSSTRKWAK